jgi:hypothetical protein
LKLPARQKPYLLFAAMLGFGTVPPHFYAILAFIVAAYIAAAEATKLVFYRKTDLLNVPAWASIR